MVYNLEVVMDQNVVFESLTRQREGLKALAILLVEEFAILTARDKSGLADMELSVQELIRQLLKERDDLGTRLGQTRFENEGLRQCLARHAQRPQLEALLQEIEELEKQCSRQATVNADLVMALVNQSQDMLSFMHDQIKPRNEEVYSRKGRFADDATEPRLLQGRF